MNTFLGASHYLPASAIDPDEIAAAQVLFLEGYMWDPPEPRAAMRRAIEIARENGVTIAFGTCADFCVKTHRKDFRALINDGLIDILFANEEEAGILEDSEPASAIESLGRDVPLVVITRGADGAVAIKDGQRFEVGAERYRRCSTRPVRAICSRPASWPAMSRGAPSPIACAWARSPRRK
jgi:sugar/nucleoside kinase (ribokinase family)